MEGKGLILYFAFLILIGLTTERKMTYKTYKNLPKQEIKELKIEEKADYINSESDSLQIQLDNLKKNQKNVRCARK